jgi:hypothetical protein
LLSNGPSPQMPAGPGKRGLFLHTVVVTGLPYAQSRYREPGKSPKPMMPRPTYNYNQEWEIVLAYDDRGEPVRTIAYRLQILNGRLIRFAVALRIRSDRNEKVRDIVRHDDFRGFHRHAPGFPPSREHDWITVPPGQSSRSSKPTWPRMPISSREKPARAGSR